MEARPKLVPAAAKKAMLAKPGYAKTLAAQSVGAVAEIVTVEANLTRGLHSFAVVDAVTPTHMHVAFQYRPRGLFGFE